MRKDSSSQEGDRVSLLVTEILDRTERCVRIWEENDISVVGTDNRDVTDVADTIACLLRPVPRAEAKSRLLSLVGCATKRPKLLGKLQLVSTSLEGEHPRARLRMKRHRRNLRLLAEELRGGLLSAVERLFELSGDPVRKSSALASSRGIVPRSRHDSVSRR